MNTLHDEHNSAPDSESGAAPTPQRCSWLTRAMLRTDRGQTTAEYALVLLAAGTIAMLVVGWAQGNDAIGGLFDAVLSKITSLIE